MTQMGHEEGGSQTERAEVDWDMTLKAAAPLALLILLTVAPACSDPVSVQVRAVSAYNVSMGMSGIRMRANEGEWITTDQDGYAVFEGLSPPFDLEIDQAHEQISRNAAFPDGYTSSHRNLWRLLAVDSRELEVKVDQYDVVDGPTCVVTGHVDSTAGDEVVFDISHLIAGPGNWATTEQDFEVELSYQLRTSEVGVYAMEGDFPISGFPTRVTAAGRIDVQIPGGKCGTLSNVDVPLSPVTTRPLALQFAAPAGLEVLASGAIVRQRFDDHPEASLFVGSGYGAEAQGTVSGLVVEGFGDAWSSAWASGPGRIVEGDPNAEWWWDQVSVSGAHSEVSERVPAGVSTVSFELPAPPVLQAPEDGVTLSRDTVYRWSAVPGVSRYTFDIGCERFGRPGGNVQAHIQTADTEVTVPSFVYDMVEPGMRCTWSVLVDEQTETRERYFHSAEGWGKVPE